jgi:uncharacterized protein (TIGR03067 family)
MRYRVAAALVVIVGLTAFAPAPFIKPTRKVPPPRLEGEWEIVSRNSWKMSPKGTVKSRVRIQPGKWAFVRDSGGVARTTAVYHLKVDTSTSPATFDLRHKENDATPYGCGIFEIKGDEMRAAYSWSASRPDALDSKKAHVYRMVLRRVK